MPRQDLELLEDADMTALDEAMRERSAGKQLAKVASEVGEALNEWLEKQEDPQDQWALPIWGVHGYLLGLVLFDAKELTPRPKPPKPPKESLGLQKAELEIPAGLKVKRLPGALELGNREAKIFVMEIPQQMYQMKMNGYAVKLPANFPRPPHLREEREMNFRLGLVSGIRAIHRHISTGLPVMIDYVLRLGKVHLSIMMMANQDQGVNLEAYESMIASIRPKGQ